MGIIVFAERAIMTMKDKLMSGKHFDFISVLSDVRKVSRTYSLLQKQIVFVKAVAWLGISFCIVLKVPLIIKTFITKWLSVFLRMI